MADTQWPRYEVFQQEKPGAAHKHAGGVHAPDAEMALMNARDVFVRRPPCVSLWVVPAAQVFARTTEELGRGDWKAGAGEGSGEPERYLVFQKLNRIGSCEYVGELEAGSPVEAMEKAMVAYENPAALWWWVVPERGVRRTTADEIESWFAPAEEKAYRQPGYFRTHTALREIRSRAGGGDEGGA